MLEATSLPIDQQLARLPDQPGVYKFYDAKGVLLYVGKAQSLRSRVRSYFLKSATLEPHKRQMVTEVADIQYLLAETPTQALHFEADLVRSSHFVQLLGNFGSRKPPDLPQTYSQYQYETAKSRGLKILQWRRPDLDVFKPHSLLHGVDLP